MKTMPELAHMCTKLPNNVLEERLRWVLPIINKQVKLKDAALIFTGGQRTLERWVAAYKKSGEAGLFPRSTRPKSHPNETSIRIKERIIELRKQDRKCAFKLVDDLNREGLLISASLVGKIIKNEGLTRKYRIRKIKYKYLKPPLAKGELVEVDIKYVPQTVENKQYYQFTAIDCASRWRYLAVYDNMGNSDGISFLKEIIKIAPFRIRAIKTDNGSCFTNRYTGYAKSADPLNPRPHAFDLLCQELNIIHYLIDPGKPAQNGKVERSHRSDQESFYEQTSFSTAEELRYKLRLWNMFYNDLQHCGLNNKTPNQMLQILN